MLIHILKIPEAEKLQEAVAAKSSSPVLDRLGDTATALRFIRANLKASYLFARFAVPSYAAAVFSSLMEFPPADDALGAMLLEMTEAVRGELFNNNIFERPGECHAHYHDMLEAYAEAGGDTAAVAEFVKLDASLGFDRAIERSALWSPKSVQYARSLRHCCHDPLAMFILMPANEDMTPLVYGRALASLSPDERFSKFRRFLERHVALDEDDHGPTVLRWLEAYVQKARVSPKRIKEATEKALAFFS